MNFNDIINRNSAINCIMVATRINGLTIKYFHASAGYPKLIRKHFIFDSTIIQHPTNDKVYRCRLIYNGKSIGYWTIEHNILALDITDTNISI